MQLDALPIARRAMLLARIEMMRLRLSGRRIAMQIGLTLVAILLGLGGVAMLMMCLHEILVDLTGPIAGSMLTGGLLLSLAAVVLFVAFRNAASQNANELDKVEALLIDGLKSDIDNGSRMFTDWDRNLVSGLPLLGTLGGLVLDAVGIRSGPARAVLAMLDPVAKRTKAR